MASIVIIGGGMCGSLLGMLLAADDHAVTILERDAAEPPATPDEAWDEWERRGVPQFRMGHYFLARFRHELEPELPQLFEAMKAAGALEQNPVDFAPASVSGGRQEGDERFTAMTGRRPAIEALITRAAADTAGVEIQRGVAVTGLIAERDSTPLHVTGVRTDDGQELSADLVIDASGRNSALSRLLVDAGGVAPLEEKEDSGFVYYGRSYRDPEGTVPPNLGGGLQNYDSVSTLTLPADNGSWFCAFIASAADKEMRAVRDEATFERAWAAYPLVAHWLEGEAEPGGVKIMAGIEDRIRHFVVDGAPVATGVVAVGDAWACTNPSVGRGASIAAIHVRALRDHLREAPLGDPVAFATAWWARTDETVRPWYDDTLLSDTLRLARIHAELEGKTLKPGHDIAAAYGVLPNVMFTAPGLFRDFLDIFFMFRTATEVFADETKIDLVLEAAKNAESAPGPSRTELLDLLAAV